MREDQDGDEGEVRGVEVMNRGVNKEGGGFTAVVLSCDSNPGGRRYQCWFD